MPLHDVALSMGSGVINPLISTPTPSQIPTFGNGPVLSTPQVVPIYWGTFAAPLLASTQAYMTGLADYLTNSGEVTVRQYGVNSASVVASYADTVLPSSSIGKGDVENEIRKLIAAGSVPAPGPQTVYMVITNGITFNDSYGSTYCGYHDYAHPGPLSSGPSFAYSLNPNPYVTGCGLSGWRNLSQAQVWQAQISHELQEAATDPQPFSGWTPEIGDPCNWGNDPTNVTVLSFGAVQMVTDARYSSCSNWSPACKQNGCAYFTPTPSAITLVAGGLGVPVALTPAGGLTGSFSVWGLPPNQVNYDLHLDPGATPYIEFGATSGATPGTLPPITIVGWTDGYAPQVTYTAQMQITIQACTPAASTCGAAGGPQCGEISLGCGLTADCGPCGSGSVCNAQNQCVAACVPTVTSCVGRCGSVQNGCGAVLECPACGQPPPVCGTPEECCAAKGGTWSGKTCVNECPSGKAGDGCRCINGGGNWNGHTCF